MTSHDADDLARILFQNRPRRARLEEQDRESVASLVTVTCDCRL